MDHQRPGPSNQRPGPSHQRPGPSEQRPGPSQQRHGPSQPRTSQPRRSFRNPLWAKNETGCFVDIFSREFHRFDVASVKTEIDYLFDDRQKKDNVLARKARLEGNEFFAQEKFHLALENYNRSLCYAVNGTDVVAMAYYKRCMCYLKIKLYKECLNDIEILKRSTYPDYMNEKLDDHQAECTKKLADETNSENVRIDNQKAALSFDEHEQFVGVADCVQMTHSEEWGRHLITKRDLQIGETVMVEDPFSFVGHDCNDLKYYRCSHCFKSLMNFIPCKECVNAMFCNNECLEAANISRHKFECQLAKRESGPCECKEKQFQLVLDMLWKINLAFESVDELIETVESLLRNDFENDIANARTSDILKQMQMVLRLPTNREQTTEPEDFQRLLLCSLQNYYVVMRSPLFNEKFVTGTQLRFLSHLILHLVHIARQSTLFNDLNVDVYRFGDAPFRDYGIGIYPVGNVLNHSCLPNVFCYSVNNRLICKVIRPIKSGQQLFRSYVCGQTILNDPPANPTIESSYNFLKSEYKIDPCQCIYCVRRRNPMLRYDLNKKTQDTKYQRIYMILRGRIDSYFRLTDAQRQSFADKAIAFLSEYEPMFPNRELFVVQVFLQNHWMLTTSQFD